MDLVGPWNRLVGIMPPTLLNILAVVGILLIVIGLGKWFWDRRRGGGAQGFPWMMLILGGVLAGPRVFVPVILMLVQAIINVISALIKGVSGL